MEGHSGGYNSSPYVPNASVQGTPFRGSPQLRAENPVRDMWQPNAVNNAAVSSSVPYSYDQQSSYSNASWPQNTNMVENVHSNIHDNYQYANASLPSYDQAHTDTSYQANTMMNTQPFMQMQNNMVSHPGPNYVQTEPVWSNTDPSQVHDNSQNYSNYSSNITAAPLDASQGMWSDSLNWRSENNTSDFNGRQNIPSTQNSYPFTPQIDWQNFVNPLTDAANEDMSADTLVQAMKQAADKAQSILEQTNRKPTSFSKSALAMLQKDLKTAAKPFESAESLKQSRDRELGILANGNQDNSIVTNMNNLHVGDISTSKLSADAVEFIPSTKTNVKTTKHSSQNEANESKGIYDSEIETTALNLIDYCVDQVTCNPACFDTDVPRVIRILRSFNLVQSAITVIVDKVYEMCVLERNFRYLGSQLCDQLSRTETGLPNFRSTLLRKAQDEFKRMENTLKDNPGRARNFTQFMAELFLNLKLESSGRLVRIKILGRGLLQAVEKLINRPDDDNIQCAVRVLKLTILKMEDSLKNDEKNSTEKLASVVQNLEALHSSRSPQWDKLTLTLLEGFINLRASNWGRSNSVTSETSRPQPNPEILSEQDENYYMNEPVFFTPSGVMYTAADAVDPEFYNNHLAQLSSQNQLIGPPQPHDRDNNPPVLPVPHQASDIYSQNPMLAPPPASRDVPYANWSSGDVADQYDSTTQEDFPYQEDYDDEYEAFLRNMGF